MKLGWKLLIGFIALFIAPLVWIAAMHFKLKHDVAAYKKQLIAKGEKLAIADWTPPRSTNQTASAALQAAVRPMGGNNLDHYPSAMRMVAPGRAQVSWKSDAPYDWDAKRKTNIWALIKNDFETNADALEALREVTEQGEFIFPVAYEQGYRAPLRHLSPLKQGAVLLSTETIYELHEENKNAAAENLKALLRLVKNYKAEPFLISHLVRFACLGIAFNATWEALQSPDWSDAELREFQEAWSAIKVDNLEATFSMERAMGIQMFAEARESGQDPMALVSGSGASSFSTDWDEFTTTLMVEPVAAIKALFNQPNQKLWRWVQSYREELALLKLWQAGVEADRAIEKEKTYQPALKNLEKRLSLMGSLREDFLFGASRSTVSKTLAKLASAKIARQLAITACALQRYQLDKGFYPAELSQLTPKFLNSVPLDPIDGKPLRYHAQTDGTFLLYSIGENGIEDQGNAELNSNLTPSRIDPDSPISKKTGWTKPVHPSRALDWVWPQPATEEQNSEWERHESGAVK